MVDLLIRPPWNHSGHACGGSLIDPSWIVTSGHCFESHKLPHQWEVRIGEHNETVEEGFEEIIAAEKIYVHPGYVLGTENSTGDFDIALIKLKRPAVFYKRVHAVCLPDAKTEFTGQLSVVFFFIIVIWKRCFARSDWFLSGLDLP